jgi:hypothetical protein
MLKAGSPEGQPLRNSLNGPHTQPEKECYIFIPQKLTAAD